MDRPLDGRRGAAAAASLTEPPPGPLPLPPPLHRCSPSTASSGGCWRRSVAYVFTLFSLFPPLLYSFFWGCDRTGAGSPAGSSMPSPSRPLPTRSQVAQLDRGVRRSAAVVAPPARPAVASAVAAAPAAEAGKLERQSTPRALPPPPTNVIVCVWTLASQPTSKAPRRSGHSYGQAKKSFLSSMRPVDLDASKLDLTIHADRPPPSLPTRGTARGGSVLYQGCPSGRLPVGS